MAKKIALKLIELALSKLMERVERLTNRQLLFIGLIPVSIMLLAMVFQFIIWATERVWLLP